MKQILLVFGLLVSFSFQNFGQQATLPVNAAHDAAARAATEQLTAKYSLTADQAKQMYTIQMRKQRNFSEIEPLKASDPAKFELKTASIQKGTTGSIKRLLNNKEQIQLFQKTQTEIRTLKAAKRKELLAKGMEKAAVETELLKIYAE